MLQHVHTQPMVTNTSNTINMPSSVPSAADESPVLDGGTSVGWLAFAIVVVDGSFFVLYVIVV